jgi:hypothetical protein
VIADTNSTPADNKYIVGGWQFEKSESRAWQARHFPRQDLSGGSRGYNHYNVFFVFFCWRITFSFNFVLI